MANERYNNIWRNEFHNNVSANDRVQDKYLDQIKLKVNVTYEKVEILTTQIEPSNDEDVVYKT